MKKALLIFTVALLILSSAVYAADIVNTNGTGIDVASAATSWTPEPAKPASTAPTTSVIQAKVSPTLKLGSKGDDVKNLQKLLNNNGYNLVVDGLFGRGTLAAVKDYQVKNSLNADGVVGPALLEKLNAQTTVGKVDYSGTYIGYAWGEEVKGVALKDTKKKIQTILELDKNGTITDASVLSFKKVDGYWVLRQSGNATIKVDFSVEPTKAIPDVHAKYVPGNSMFNIKTGADDLMSIYTVAVDKDGTAAILIADPMTRYLFEMKFKPGYDYSTKVGEVTIDSGQLVPTILTEDGGTKIKDWSELDGKSIFRFSPFSHVLNSRGVLAGINDKSTVQEFLEKMGVEFIDSKPVPTAAKYGYTGPGGWAGNYKAIEDFLKGKNALELTSLIDWSIERYKKGINANNFFGVDIVAGATKTVQNSFDTIAGATVRMSRESNSYQEALVKAGILKEEDVIKGRY